MGQRSCNLVVLQEFFLGVHHRHCACRGLCRNSSLCASLSVTPSLMGKGLERSQLGANLKGCSLARVEVGLRRHLAVGHRSWHAAVGSSAPSMVTSCSGGTCSEALGVASSLPLARRGGDSDASGFRETSSPGVVALGGLLHAAPAHLGVPIHGLVEAGRVATWAPLREVAIAQLGASAQAWSARSSSGEGGGSVATDSAMITLGATAESVSPGTGSPRSSRARRIPLALRSGGA